MLFSCLFLESFASEAAFFGSYLAATQTHRQTHRHTHDTSTHTQTSLDMLPSVQRSKGELRDVALR